MKEKWCCFGLENAFSKREERGIFVFATPPDEGEIKPSFWLGMRSVNKKDQLDFSEYLNEKCENYSLESFISNALSIELRSGG